MSSLVYKRRIDVHAEHRML